MLTTERLTLAPFTADAITALLEGDAARLTALTGYEFPQPLRPPPLMEELLPQVRDRLTSDPASLGWWTWLAAERTSGLVTGALGFGGPPDAEGAVMIGIAERKAMIDREHDLSITKQAEIFAMHNRRTCNVDLSNL